MRCLLSEKRILSIKATNKRQEYWDQSFPGFGMRVAKEGQKTFFVMYRENGRQKRKSLGKYPIISLSDARDLAREKLRLVSLGLPVAELKHNTMTVNEAFDSFIEIYAKKNNKDWKRAEGRLRNNLIKEYGDIDIKSVTRENIISLLDKIEKRGASIQANRVLAGTSKFFKWCAERSYIDSSPVLYISKPAKERPRDRVLTDAEISIIWSKAETMGYPFGHLFQMLILTGQRKSEVSDMRWSELNLDEKIWIIPKERAKNGHAHIIPLSDAVINLLRTIPRFLDSDFVFTTNGKTSVSGFGKIKSRIDNITGIKGWVIHDIRRTVASGMARLKVPPHVVEKILNHISGTFSGVTGVYNRFGYDEEKREALCKWEQYVLDLISPLDKIITSD